MYNLCRCDTIHSQWVRSTMYLYSPPLFHRWLFQMQVHDRYMYTGCTTATVVTYWDVGAPLAVRIRCDALLTRPILTALVHGRDLSIQACSEQSTMHCMHKLDQYMCSGTCILVCTCIVCILLSRYTCAVDIECKGWVNVATSYKHVYS